MRHSSERLPECHEIDEARSECDVSFARLNGVATRTDSPFWRLNSSCGFMFIGMLTVIVIFTLFLLRRSIFFNALLEALSSVVTTVLKDGLFRFLTYVQDLDTVSGPLLLAVVYAFCIVLFVPVTILNLAAGFCFGVVVGFISVSGGGIAGASIAFLLGRTIAREWVGTSVLSAFDSSPLDNMLQRNPQSAFKIVCLSRLPPCLPFPCVNYSYALTNVPFWTYFWATWLGLAPGTFAYVYMGSAVRNLADVVSGQHAGGPMYFVVLGLGVFGSFAVAIYLMREAQLVLGIGNDGTSKEDCKRDYGSHERKGSSFGVRNRSSSNSPRSEIESQHAWRRLPSDELVPKQQKSKKKSFLEAVRPVDTGRELQRDGDFILFSASRKSRGNQPKRPREIMNGRRQRTLTRNSSIWNLFNRKDSKDDSQYRTETQQLEYFL